MMNLQYQKPTNAFVYASWTAFIFGCCAYLLGLWNSTMELNEKGYYFCILLLGVFAAISLQKTVRDKQEGINVTYIYLICCIVALVSSIVLFAVGLRNATLLLSEKGFFAMAFVLVLFSIITIQKNIRDIAVFDNKQSLAKDFSEV